MFLAECPIKEAAAKPGAVLHPHSSLESIRHVLPDLHHVLIMSVNPGFGGQAFIPSVLDKIRTLRSWIDDAGLDTLIEIDGGVKASNIGAIREAGVDVFVAGSAVFNAESYAESIAALRAGAAG